MRTKITCDNVVTHGIDKIERIEDQER